MPSPTGMPAVLVIESTKFQRRSLCRLMRASGADHVAEATDIGDARRVLGKDPATRWLVVADPDLIGASGIAALKSLADAFPIAGTLLLSHRRANLLAELRNQAEKEGLELVAVLRKPVSAEEIGTLLLQTRELQPPVRAPDARARVLSKDDLSECLRAGSLRARFQPKVDLESGRPVGCDAVPYVIHARYGTLPEASFSHALRELGAQRVVTASLLRDAAELVRSLRDRGLDTKVVVKLGSDMLSETGDAASLDAYVRTLGIVPADLAFEIAASKDMTSSITFDDNLARLKVRGYSLVIDVTAFEAALDESACAHFSEMKVRLPGASTQRRPGMSAKDLSVVPEIARQRGVAACAIGVQTEADLDSTRRAGFRLAQGELFAPALRAEQAVAWVAREDKERSFADRTPKRHRAGS